MVLVQKWPFFQLFFLGNIGHENVFYDVLEQKNASLGHQNKKFKKSKNWHFSNGFPMVFPMVFPWFSSKNSLFSNLFFLGTIGQENVFYDILEEKNAFLGYKNKKFRKSNNWRLFVQLNTLRLLERYSPCQSPTQEGHRTYQRVAWSLVKIVHFQVCINILAFIDKMSFYRLEWNTCRNHNGWC